MSEVSSLTELARFVGQSTLASDNQAIRRRAVNAIATRLSPRMQRRGVTDLLAVVMALSARTRRMLLPQTQIDLDVFGPDGKRAVRMSLPR